MKTVIVNSYGGPEVLELTQTKMPEPQHNQIRIRIKATSVTRASTMMREGMPYFGRLFTGIKRPKVKTPGTDLSGIVDAIGSSVTEFQIGDAVMAETGLDCGTYAEYICLNKDELIVKQPDGISPEEATGILDGASTALAFFTDSITIKPGQRVLINGASGSIGTAAVQLAKHFQAEVTGICSGKNSFLVKELGADSVLDYTKDDLKKDDYKFDVIFDTVGKLSYGKSKKFLVKGGAYLTPVLSMKTLLSMLFIAPFGSKKLKFAATGLRKNSLQMRDLKVIRELLDSEKLRPVIDRTYSLEDIQEAHAYVDQGHKRGNVVVLMSE